MYSSRPSDPAERSAMLGPESDWVKNVEAAHGDAVIRQGRRRRVHLVAVPTEQRAPILREYVRIASSGRQHFPLAVGAPLSEFEAIAGRYRVYGIRSCVKACRNDRYFQSLISQIIARQGPPS
jgi:hypothetical protein